MLSASSAVYPIWLTRRVQHHALCMDYSRPPHIRCGVIPARPATAQNGKKGYHAVIREV